MNVDTVYERSGNPAAIACDLIRRTTAFAVEMPEIAARAWTRCLFPAHVRIKLNGLIPKPYQENPETIGQHIKKQRLLQGLSQKDTAKGLGVNSWTVLNWEKGHTKPPIESMPAIIRFLGYDPFPMPKTIPERLRAKRRAMGWSIKEAARQLGVDEGTWKDWEHGKTILFRKHRLAVAEFLGLPPGEVGREMKDQWNRSHPRE